MDIKPVKSYKRPLYPQKEEVRTDACNYSNLPRRWKGKLSSGLLMTLFSLSLLSGCDRGQLEGEALPRRIITEDEAIRIIQDEFELLNLRSSSKGTTIKNVKIPVSSYGKNTEKSDTKYAIDIEPDLFIEDKNISIEYFSEEDSKALTENWYFDEPIVKERLNDNTIGIFNNSYDESLLREQVKEFIKWLKAEKII